MQLHEDDLMVSRWGIRAISSLVEKEPAKPRSREGSRQKMVRTNEIENKIKSERHLKRIKTRMLSKATVSIKLYHV